MGWKLRHDPIKALFVHHDSKVAVGSGEEGGREGGEIMPRDVSLSETDDLKKSSLDYFFMNSETIGS